MFNDVIACWGVGLVGTIRVSVAETGIASGGKQVAIRVPCYSVPAVRRYRVLSMRHLRASLHTCSGDSAGLLGETKVENASLHALTYRDLTIYWVLERSDGNETETKNQTC